MRGETKTSLMLLVGGLTVWSACGGGVVAGPSGAAGADGGIDAAAGAGGGGAGFGASAGSGGTWPDCGGLKANFDDKLATAIACNPVMSSIQCSKDLMIPDACGCPVAANQKTPEAAKASGDAFLAWKNSGCAYACGVPCVDAANWYCQPGEDGTSGVCTPSPTQ